MNQISKYKLKVVGGIHKHAELIIEPEEKYTIGSSDTCDIIFIDPGVEKEHVCLYSYQENVILVKKSANIYIDGEMLIEQEKGIKAYQVITIGDAHFSIGPNEIEWPLLTPAEMKDELIFPACRDLVPITIVKQKRWLNFVKDKIYEYCQNTKKTIFKFDSKLIFGIGIFCFVFFLFWVDFIQSGITCVQQSDIMNGSKNKGNKSVLIYANSMLNKITDSGLVGTGVKEPALNVHEENAFKIEPLQKVREYLYSKWKSALTENIISNKEISYQGINRLNQNNLSIKFRKESDGIYTIEGFTLTKDERRGLITNLGDIVRVKVIADEDIADVCQKVMQKKEIRNPSVQLDIEKKTATLEGETDDLNAISEIETILAKTVPEIMLNNKINFSPEDLNIIGASTGDKGYIQLNDGCKIFIGGKLKNGCIIENIQAIDVQLNCLGSKVNYRIGEKS